MPASVSAYKEERQNLVIESVSESEGLSEDLLRASFLILTEKIKDLNSSSSAKFMLLDQGHVISQVFSKSVFLPFLGFFIFFFLVIFTLAVYEFFH